MILPVLEINDTYVAVLVFYSAKDTLLADSGYIAFAIQKFEKISGKSKHRHVGISLGILTNQRTIRLLPFDFSCWSGRNSGATQISKFSLDSKDNKLICASDAIYFELDPEIYKSLVSSLTSFDTSTANQSSNGLPVNNIQYPSINTILSDYVKSLYYIFVPATVWKMNEADACLNQNAQCAQCSQWALGLIIYCIRNNSIHVGLKQKNEILSLLLDRTSLHPHKLFKVLLKSKCFKHLSEEAKITLAGEKIAIKKVWLESPETLSIIPITTVWEFFEKQSMQV
jgi:hypothetical protein